MGLPRWCSCTAVVLALLLGCTAPYDREVVVPKPVIQDGKPVTLVYDAYVTPRGTDVEIPGFIAERRELFLLALQEIDNLNFYLEFPRWMVRIVPPGDSESVNAELKTITIAWRPDGHEPRDQMLPNLKKLMDEAFAK
ncbi:MAG: hypothetical protein AB7L09_00795 [Nitrospira sp.]